MKPMRARRTPKWQLSVANVFALLRERYLKMDTIPKPGGLDFASAQSLGSVRLMSGVGPGIVRPLSGGC